MKRALSSRALLWIGLALVVASPLLDTGALLPWFIGRALPETPGLLLAERLAQSLIFAAAIAVLLARRPGTIPFPVRAFGATAAAFVGMQAATLLFVASSGVLEVLWAGAAVGLLLIALRGAACLLADALGTRWRFPVVSGPLLCVAAVTLTAALLEGLLAFQAHLPTTPVNPATPKAGAQPLVMPESLSRRETKVAGAKEAFYWQGKLHVRDANRIRRSTPILAKTPGTFRIAAFGDSLTYGEGVAAEEAWPAVLEQELQRQFRVEVINLGVGGWQSEDILRFVERMLPALEADLVLYGVCLNDYLPSGWGQYTKNRAWTVNLPYGFHLEVGTRLGGLIAAAYDRLLMRIGVRADFYTDILRDFRNFQKRFAADTAAMNRFVTARGLPPVTTMVLEQFPLVGEKSWQIVQLTEKHLLAAGMTVVPADYIRVHSGRNLSVNRWESHPNPEAQRIFAEELLNAVRRDPRLRTYLRATEAAAPRR